MAATETTDAIGSHEQVNYVINGLLFIIVSIVGFFVRTILNNQKDANAERALLKADISNLKTELAVNSTDDKNHRAQFEKIEGWMIRIETKLDALKSNNGT